MYEQRTVVAINISAYNIHSYLRKSTEKVLVIVTAIVRTSLMQAFETPSIQLAGKRSKLCLTKVCGN